MSLLCVSVRGASKATGWVGEQSEEGGRCNCVSLSSMQTCIRHTRKPATAAIFQPDVAEAKWRIRALAALDALAGDPDAGDQDDAGDSDAALDLVDGLAHRAQGSKARRVNLARAVLRALRKRSAVEGPEHDDGPIAPTFSRYCMDNPIGFETAYEIGFGTRLNVSHAAQAEKHGLTSNVFGGHTARPFLRPPAPKSANSEADAPPPARPRARPGRSGRTRPGAEGYLFHNRSEASANNKFTEAGFLNNIFRMRSTHKPFHRECTFPFGVLGNIF